MNDAVGSKLISLLAMWPITRHVTVKLQEKNRSMFGDVITVVVLFGSIETIRSDHIKGGVHAERLEEIADIDTSVGRRCICVRITVGFHGHRRQCEQLIVAVI